MTTYPKRTPLEAIRVFCVECQGGSFQGVSECGDTACPFHLYRHGSALAKGKHAPVRACRAYCFTYCLLDSGADAVRDCGGNTALLGPCPVFPFRMGKNPNRRALSPERRAALIESGRKFAFKPGAKRALEASESAETKQADL